MDSETISTSAEQAVDTEALEAGGCSIPFPQRDLHVVTLPAGGKEAVGL